MLWERLSPLLLLCFLVGSGQQVQADGGWGESASDVGFPRYSSALTSGTDIIPCVPIAVTSDAEFSPFPGSGTAADPYVIEDCEIGTSLADAAIEISGTTAFFLIRNNFVQANRWGIHVHDVADGTAKIIGNTCETEFKQAGIRVVNADYSEVSENNCTRNFDRGIYVENSHHSLIANNTCSGNVNAGISVWRSDFVKIADNVCTGQYHTNIYLLGDNSTIVRNRVEGSYYGIIVAGDHNEVEDNLCQLSTDAGIRLEGDFNQVSANTCVNNEYGVRIKGNGNNFTDNTIEGNEVGIYFWGKYNNITYNSFLGNTHWGAEYYSSHFGPIVFEKDKGYNNIYGNCFIDNNRVGFGGGFEQAYDRDGWHSENNWYDVTTNRGNYWSDWDGTGSYILPHRGGRYPGIVNEDPAPLLSCVAPGPTITVQVWGFNLGLPVAWLIVIIAFVPLPIIPFLPWICKKFPWACPGPQPPWPIKLRVAITAVIALASGIWINFLGPEATVSLLSAGIIYGGSLSIAYLYLSRLVNPFMRR